MEVSKPRWEWKSRNHPMHEGAAPSRLRKSGGVPQRLEPIACVELITRRVASTLPFPQSLRDFHSHSHFETSTPTVTSRLPLPESLRDFHSHSHFETSIPAVSR